MALRKIVEQGDEVLNKVCRPVTEFNKRLHDLLDDMIEARRESVLLQQRMDSEPKDFYRLLKKSHLLKQYLQQYPKEYSTT